MSLEDILNSDRFRLPLNKPAGTAFYPYLTALLDDYIQALEADPDFLNIYPSIRFDEDVFVEKVKAVTVLIKAIFTDREHAYERFEELMNAVFLAIYDSKYCEAQIEQGAEFYRCVSSDAPLSKSRFFHAPFHIPHSIGQTRFTEASYPALYLTNSLAAGYLETRTADINHFQAVKFKSNVRLNMLDLDYTLGNSADLLQGLKQQRLGMLYPLYAACFVIYRDADRTPQEYILPGFIFKWLRRGKGVLFDGILYASTKTASPNYTHRFFNLVIPPKEWLPEGWCPHLKDRVFQMSEVCQWQTQHADIEAFFAANYPHAGIINDDVATIEWPDGGAVSTYEHTELGVMEFFMRYHLDMTAKPIDF